MFRLDVWGGVRWDAAPLLYGIRGTVARATIVCCLIVMKGSLFC